MHGVVSDVICFAMIIIGATPQAVLKMLVSAW